MFRKWHPIPSPAIKRSTAGLGGPATPLLEEEGDSVRLAVVSEAPHPVRTYRARVVTGLPSRDQPVDAVEVQFDGADQGLGRDEPHRSRDLAQGIETPGRLLVFYADADPDVLRPGQLLCHPRQPQRALRQQLVSMAGCGGHDVEDTGDENAGHAGMKEVAHRVDKYDPGSGPAVRQLQGVLMDRHPEAGSARAWITIGLVFRVAHGFESLRESKGITMLATGRDPITSRDRIPGRLCPLNRTTVCHNP